MKLTWNDLERTAGKSSFTRRKTLPAATTQRHDVYVPPIPAFVPSSGPLPMPSKAERLSAGRTVPTARSALEEQFALQLRSHRFPKWVREYRFDKIRRYRFDFAWPDQKVAVEIEGGIWTKGGHSSGKGITRDAEKSNLAQLQGWLVLRFVESHLADNTAIAQCGQALGV